MKTSKRLHRFLIAAGALVLLLSLTLTGSRLVSAAPAGMTFNVTDLIDVPDVNPGDGKCETAPGNKICTLRGAVQEANALPGPDTINLQAQTTYKLTRVGTDDTALYGDLDVKGELTINGADQTVIDGIGSISHDRVFELTGIVTISHVMIVNGKPAPGPGGAIYNHVFLTLTDSTIQNNGTTGASGGGIYNEGTATIIHSQFLSNKAALGGAIYNAKTINVLNSSFVQNSAENGGAILNSSNAFVSLDADSDLSSNNADQGAGIYNYGAASILNSTIASNHARFYGGGIAEHGSLILANSTLSENRAGSNGGGIGAVFNGSAILVNSTLTNNLAEYVGGGIFQDGGTFNLRNVTISSNKADSDKDGNGSGGGIYLYQGTLNLRNSLISDNYKMSPSFYVDDDCKGPLTSQDYNLIRTTTGCSIGGATAHNKYNKNPFLEPLHDNGGPTYTQAVQSGSPAINSGNPKGCTDFLGSLLLTDQRGYQRPVGSACDIGAFEFGSDAPPEPSKTPVPTNTPHPTETPQPTQTPTGCNAKPAKPTLSAPGNADTVKTPKVKLQWSAVQCAKTYKFILKQDTKHSKPIQKSKPFQATNAKTQALNKGHEYFWKVKACNPSGCSASKLFTFTLQ